MSQMTNYLEGALINHVLRNTAMTSPTTVYAALHTADPTETGATGELSGNAYERTAIAFGAATDGVSTNSGDVTFPTATGDWGIVTHFSIWDAQTSGNALLYGSLTAQKTVNNGDTFKFLTGNVTVTFA